MRDAHRGLDLVDVLSALAARAIRIDEQILGTNVDLDSIVDLRNHKTSCARMLLPITTPTVSATPAASMPLRSAKRRIMRNKIGAQSCDSVPPAPGLMVMIALR